MATPTPDNSGVFKRLDPYGVPLVARALRIQHELRLLERVRRSFDKYFSPFGEQQALRDVDPPRGPERLARDVGPSDER